MSGSNGVCSRRRLPLTVLASLLIGAAQQARAQDDACPDANDLLLTGGRIHTMAGDGEVVTSLRVIADRVAAAGRGSLGADRCTTVIDLNGRTAIPGIIDNHNHIVLLGLRPGHDTRLESASSIAEVLDTIGARANEVPAGEWITAIGGFDISQFTPAPAAPRFPTRAELDTVSASHPVYIQQSFSGPGVTNSRGKAFFEAAGIEVGEAGEIAGGFQMPNAATRALYALRQMQSLEDEKRGTIEALDYAAGLGITTHLDQGGFPATGTASDGAAHFDRYRAYDALIQLHREGLLTSRVRLNYLHMETDPATPELRARLLNVIPEHGDEMLRVVGIGEFTAGSSPMITEVTDPWLNGTRLVAEAGWRNENHSLTQNDFAVIIDGWESVHESLDPPGISELGWVLAHAPFITREYADKLARLGGGVSVLGGWRYISGTAEANGPPFRMLLDSGVRVGMSSDGMQIAPLNPWLGLYYVVTGRNARGELINEGQTLTRQQALGLYTAANGWFLREEADIGTLEAGKYADIAVLSDDYFDAGAVSDGEIRELRSLLTIVGGRIVHGDPDAL